MLRKYSDSEYHLLTTIKRARRQREKRRGGRDEERPCHQMEERSVRLLLEHWGETKQENRSGGKDGKGAFRS
jgi:hypothetical protein